MGGPQRPRDTETRTQDPRAESLVEMDFRVIPSIEQLRQRDLVRALERAYGHDAVVTALREEADALRQRIARHRRSDADPADRQPATSAEAAAVIEREAERRLLRDSQPSLRLVINATGVIIHTNLGRAPLAGPALARLAAIAGGYSNLEYDLEGGSRGARDLHAEALLRRLTGCEAAALVNNNAAATLLLLTALAAGREVVISRGELVEIGGGFRVPEVMAQSGAVLREVGTTNRTRIADYESAITDRTSLILRVHRSNFRIEGFTEQPTLEELVALGRRSQIPVAEDLGSGWLLGGPAEGAGEPADTLSAALRDEPRVQASVGAGVDVLCFSGDKLLGGPQAGILLGRASLLARIRRHPLMRALRADKMTYAALEATLSEYLSGRAAQTVPVVRMIAMPEEAIAARAEVLASRLQSIHELQVTLVKGTSTIGGGSAPGSALPTRLVALRHRAWSADRLDQELRRLDPPVVARIENDQVMLDLRTVLPDQDDVLATLLARLGDAPPVTPKRT